jgi:hypothetical protein
LKYEFV